MISPCRTRSKSPQSSATISDRRNPPAKPIKSSARSRASFMPSPMASSTRNRSSRSSGFASRWAIPRVRLTPRNVARTISVRQGLGSPLASCAFEIVAMRRTSVATLSVSACRIAQTRTVSADFTPIPERDRGRPRRRSRLIAERRPERAVEKTTASRISTDSETGVRNGIDK